MTRLLALVVGVLAHPVPVRDERGLSQSTENAVLLTGAIAIAATVITLVGAYVRAHLPR